MRSNNNNTPNKPGCCNYIKAPITRQGASGWINGSLPLDGAPADPREESPITATLLDPLFRVPI